MYVQNIIIEIMRGFIIVRTYDFEYQLHLILFIPFNKKY